MNRSGPNPSGFGKRLVVQSIKHCKEPSNPIHFREFLQNLRTSLVSQEGLSSVNLIFYLLVPLGNVYLM